VKLSRREVLKKTAKMATGSASLSALPVMNRCIGKGKRELTLDFRVIHDPDGWHPSLRLKGDWILVRVSDGNHVGHGEISHSKNDEKCKQVAKELFQAHVWHLEPSISNIQKLERGHFSKAPDFVTATAISGLNQALYELVAQKNSVPVWKLFVQEPVRQKVEVYTTINRCLKKRTIDEYLEIVKEVREQGYKIFKCAPFEKVTGPNKSFEHSRYGLKVLETIRASFPDMGIRVDFHTRFTPEGFYEILPELHKVKLNWLEEPFKFSNAYEQLRTKTTVPIAGGELYFGTEAYKDLMARKWVDVIMPDVKHVGGFGPLLDVCRMAGNSVRVSPHNPSGPVSTAASMHCSAVMDNASSLEIPFDPSNLRKQYGNKVENGFFHLNKGIGWGINLPT